MIQITTLPSATVLEQRWRELAVRSPHSFFLSWPWIGTWLHCIPATIRPELLTVYSAGNPVAAAIVVKKTIWRRNVMPVKTWILNATGDRKVDCICTEHNGLLVSTEHERGVWAEVLEYFLTKENDWDEFRLDGVAPWLADAWTNKGLPVRQTRLDVSRFVNLTTIRETSDCSCISFLPSRIRTRLRHTTVGVERRFGRLRVSEASTALEALGFLAELKDLHVRRWGGRPNSHAFSRPFFGQFHAELIARYFPSGLIQLARVSAGPVTLGFLYNFVYENRVLFYQSGINYAAAERGESIGLLAHVLLIDRNARHGRSVYDMLAGDAQYKRALASFSTQLWWGALQSARLKLRAEKLAIKSYRRLRTNIRNILHHEQTEGLTLRRSTLPGRRLG